MEPCATHDPKSRWMGYMAHSEWMARQRDNPRRCPKCRRWLYLSEYGPGWNKGERMPDATA